jgi:hypothetical protein
MTLIQEIRAIAGQYPETRSAILPALHLAGAKRRLAPPQALEEVGTALGVTLCTSSRLPPSTTCSTWRRWGGIWSRSAPTSRVRSSEPSRWSRPSSES